MTRTLLRFSSFAFVLLWAIAAQARSTAGEIAFSGTYIARGTFGLEGQAPVSFSSEKAKKENFKPVDGEKVLGKIRWLELMRWNYIGHDPKQFRHYGPMGPDILAAPGNDALINPGDNVGSLTIAVEALKKRTRNLIKVLGESAELKVRIGVPEMLALSIQLLFD